ncbi:MAG TPA: hypothetical protein VOA78_11940 [Candidatus Dormibacteraeota bacterium]|nr:hypothetical protein [Candidatus Dormibacteraeota bacterium]
MDLNLFGTVTGFLIAGVVILITLIRQRRFEMSDLGPFFVSFLAGTNLPAAIFLCGYALAPDPAAVPTKLHGLERFVSFAGLSLLLVSLVSIWALVRGAAQKPAPAPQPQPALAPMQVEAGNQPAGSNEKVP